MRLPLGDNWGVAAHTSQCRLAGPCGTDSSRTCPALRPRVCRTGPGPQRALSQRSYGGRENATPDAISLSPSRAPAGQQGEAGADRTTCYCVSSTASTAPSAEGKGRQANCGPLQL